MISGNKISEYALFLRESFGLSPGEPIQNLIELIQNAGFKYIEKSFGNEFSGFSRSLGGGNFLIGFNIDHDWGENFKRFTISHELGHVSIIEHQNILYGNGNHYSLSEFSSQDQVEKEADLFAINFLAPADSFRTQIGSQAFTNDVVVKTAEYFKISTYATALRFVEVTDLSCVLVVCNNKGIIEYEKRSRRLNDAFAHDLIFRNKINGSTLTWDYVRGQATEQTCTVNLQDWYPNLPIELQATESVIELNYNNKILALITPDVADIDEFVKEQRY